MKSCSARHTTHQDSKKFTTAGRPLNSARLMALPSKSVTSIPGAGLRSPAGTTPLGARRLVSGVASLVTGAAAAGAAVVGGTPAPEPDGGSPAQAATAMARAAS